jgi:hypothetical protein
MEDKTTPHLGLEQQGAILTGSDFLAGREAQLRLRLGELEEELKHLEDATDDIQTLEGQAADALRALFDVLEPETGTSPATIQPLDPKGMPAEVSQPMVVRQMNRRKRFWRLMEIAAALLVLALSTFVLVRLYGPNLFGSESQATATVLLTPTTRASAVPTATRPARQTATPAPLPSATPLPSPTLPAPVVVDEGSWTERTICAETLRFLDGLGTPRLELPLTVMAETIQSVAGAPVLKPLLPSEGAGLYRGSAPFGEAGLTAILVPAQAAPPDLWQVRPGERLVGCNTDGTCYEYRIVLAETWLLDQVRQVLAEWPADGGVLVYTAADELSAWVIQAQLQREEGR